MNKIVVASDSFKGCLTSWEVAEAAEDGIRSVLPRCGVVKLGVADGGEGTAEVVVRALGGRMNEVTVDDPLGRSVKARYGMAAVDGARTAVVEMAAASGLPLLRAEERDPLRASSYGTGQLMMDAIGRGCRRLLMCIGGSATCDGGLGMLSALGFVFLDREGRRLEGRGADLTRVARIDRSGVPQAVLESEYLVACDVDTPFCGPDGAARVFGPQKGATPQTVELLERGMRSFAEVMTAQLGTDITAARGAGAAGGLGGALKAFLHGRLTGGADLVLDAIGFDRQTAGADLVITGEGRMDSQTACGKVAAGVLRRATRLGVPVAAVTGQVVPCPELRAMGFAAVRCINEPSVVRELAMRGDYARERVRLTVAALVREKSPLQGPKKKGASLGES